MIRFDSVSKLYASNPRPALNNVSLEILKGEFVFLVGASGSGKSSFLRLVLREEKPSKGDIHVLGQQLTTLSSRKVPYFRRNLGVVFQDFRLLPQKTVFDNVAFTLQVIGKSKGFIQEAVPDVLKMVGLAGKAHRFPHELSGGEQQRVAIARALVNRPQVLLADEPTGNLDPATSVDIMQLLARINAGGTTVLMATHEAGFVDQMQRRVIELSDGEMVRDEVHGGYGDTSNIPRLVPEEVRGAAAAAALTAVQEVQRQTADLSMVRAALAEELSTQRKAAAAVDRDGETVVPPAPRTVEPPEPAPSQAADSAANVVEPPAAVEPPAVIRPRTHPITLPTVDVAELGVADRLGLSDEDDEEVGPTS